MRRILSFVLSVALSAGCSGATAKKIETDTAACARAAASSAFASLKQDIVSMLAQDNWADALQSLLDSTIATGVSDGAAAVVCAVDAVESDLKTAPAKTASAALVRVHTFRTLNGI